jgi:hypothetical protein
MLTGAMAGPARDVEDERANARRFLNDIADCGEAPRDRRDV